MLLRRFCRCPIRSFGQYRWSCNIELSSVDRFINMAIPRHNFRRIKLGELELYLSFLLCDKSTANGWPFGCLWSFVHLWSTRLYKVFQEDGCSWPSVEQNSEGYKLPLLPTISIISLWSTLSHFAIVVMKHKKCIFKVITKTISGKKSTLLSLVFVLRSCSLVTRSHLVLIEVVHRQRNFGGVS